MKKMCICLALLCMLNIAASPTTVDQKTDKKTLIAHILNILAQTALAISTKDKEKRIEAAALALTSLSLIIHLIVGKNEPYEQNKFSHTTLEPISIERAYQLLEEHPDFLNLCDEERTDCYTALKVLLAACPEIATSDQFCADCAS